jgi:hypothetical protein
MNCARLVAVAGALLAGIVLAGCGHKPYDISDGDRRRFAAGLINVERPGKPPLIEGVEDCVVWKAQYSGDRITGWKAALGADWGGTYPKFLTACLQQSIAYRDKRVAVWFCARAIGAGGGCNNGGHYWSYTGERPWRVSWDGVHWRDLPQ